VPAERAEQHAEQENDEGLHGGKDCLCSVTPAGRFWFAPNRAIRPEPGGFLIQGFFAKPFVRAAFYTPNVTMSSFVPATMPESSTTKKTPGRALRVIYAEDLPELRQLMRLVLGREGHSLEAFADGSLALERIQQAPDDFDLLVTDHHMPVMNGLELVQQVRRMPFAGRIIVFSSELSPEVHDDYVALGVDRVLAKPVRPGAFRQLLADLFPAENPV
jgi:CheY-like chemotaxis protein